MKRPLIIISQYSSYATPAWAEDYRREGAEVSRLDIRKKAPEKFISKRQVLTEWATAFIKWFAKTPRFRNKSVYCTAAQIPVMALCRIWGWMLGDATVVFHNFYLHGMGQKAAVRKIIAILLNSPRFTMLAQSQSECNYYSNLAPKAAVRFAPFCSDFEPITDSLPEGFTIPDGGYLFTGGYTNRDYPLVLEMSRRFPSETFVIVASHLNDLHIPAGTKNVVIMRDLPKEQFESLLAHSKAVIVPLREDVGASGQMLSISAIRNGRPTVYADLSVINYYFVDNAGIPYRIGDADSMADAIRQILSDPAKAKSLGENARKNGVGFRLDSLTPIFRSSLKLN